MPPSVKHDVGSRFGRWVLLERMGRVGRCQCDCGETKIVNISTLYRGQSKSCGCLLRELAGERKTTHGLSKNPAYRVWWGMHQRCSNTSHRSFKDYGGRGITVCKEWYDPNVFIRDMGVPPLGLTLERLDGNKGYSKDNCVWATPKAQCRNRRSNVIIEFDGKSQCLAAWAEEIGISVSTLHKRIAYGWTVHDALTKPLGKQQKNKFVEYAGEWKTIKQWSKHFGLKYPTLKSQLSRGLNLDKIIDEMRRRKEEGI